ncbi:tumor necrosis factor ligand superfamily member 6-like isoform X1 [Oncorhynchus mykiss]|uniref:Fas ligand (TNF superfamily, member 6) n=1 Tax=Oncorhynchus mykiss TaxID=8022 RepID=A0A8C7T7Z3_ONCMY|nr:tumor necrosis factor ligand superfamily member 6-like isoform X1 [Oncorhynchus mykiss]
MESVSERWCELVTDPPSVCGWKLWVPVTRAFIRLRCLDRSTHLLHTEATHTLTLLSHTLCTMSGTQGYPYPQVFLVDSGRGPQPSVQPPGMLPCWSFPPAQERVMERGRGRGCRGVGSWSLTMALLFLLLLVFGALGLGTYQIIKLQTQLDGIQQEINTEIDGRGPEKLVGDLPETDPNRGKTAGRPAAHVIGRIEKHVSQNTLRWEPKAGRAFTEGGVVYRDGGLQVNETGLYHIYSRVQFEANHCTPTDALVHSVFVRRPGNRKSLTLMEGHREGYCNLGSHGHVWTSGSYLGSTLKLEKQDWLYVNVSHPAMLSHAHHANFFGLHKI